ncbi:hypothetical protein NDU88_001979 [Pleurodeles waltl]|uniref:Uncharacterized protein n=1 Tax=Pleurodeles waltl TaxID=8319 RepID=A0AAV7M0U9_PLEWA|nr:hypothetical protein NDU88_001979 [Pleurodeles waltl]
MLNKRTYLFARQVDRLLLNVDAWDPLDLSYPPSSQYRPYPVIDLRGFSANAPLTRCLCSLATEARLVHVFRRHWRPSWGVGEAMAYGH